MADVLVVDDNEEIAGLVAELMLQAGHDVRVAHDGAEGLSALSDRLPDLVLLDVDMPVLDGPGMAYRMLVEDCGRETLPIVLCSAAANLRKIALRVGTPYALTKPFDPDALMDVTARALGERTPPTPTL
jgi:CheY-like chemotaxis protein